MARLMHDYLSATMPDLRYEPLGRRLRALREDRTVCDTLDAMLVWEPRRVVPGYAVPEAALDAKLVEAGPPTGTTDHLLDSMGPGVPPAHTTPGQPLDVHVDGTVLEGAAFRPDDAELAGYVFVDFGAFDWLEEDQPMVGHPHDPFKRIDTTPSTRHVVVSLDGVVLADTRRAVALFETGLPTRWYIPRDDVRMDLLEASTHLTTCAYKGHASYYSVTDGGRAGRALVWTYREPLQDAVPVKDMLCFFAERSDLVVDGEPVPRPITFWSPRERREDNA